MADARNSDFLARIGIPADLGGVLLLLVIADVTLLAPVIRQLPVRIVTGFLVLLFLPGYVLTAVLFPERGGPTADAGELIGGSSRRGIDGIERVVLSVALSLVLVMATALALDVSGVGISLASTLVVVNALVVVLTAGATIRRRRVPPAQRYRPEFGAWRAGLRAELATFDRLDRGLSVLLVVLLVVVVAGAAYTIAVPSEDDRRTELYLLAEGPDGNLTASEYPTNFSVGESTPLVVGVTNQEHRTVGYTVVVEFQNTTRRSQDARVRSARELHRFERRLEHGETWQQRHTIRPTQPGTNLRLQYLLYRDGVPENPSRATAYRRVHLWINVSGGQRSVVPAASRPVAAQRTVG